MEEKIKLEKNIMELNYKINNYERKSAIELISRVRIEHPGKEQLAYIFNNILLT